MFQKHRMSLAALACMAMAAAGDAGSDTGGTGTGSGTPTTGGEPPAPSPAPTPAPKPVKLTPVRVLVDCMHGKANDLAQLAAGDLKTALEQGYVDDDKAAVSYAASLAQNKAKKE